SDKDRKIKYKNALMSTFIELKKDYKNPLQYEKIAAGKTLVVAGGVAANKAIRSTLLSVAQESGYNFVAPPINLCTDNAAMIAFAGLERFYAGIIDDVSFKPRARWSLEDL
ncbi:MAG: hypothetical protein EBY20_05515, partial [Alphaproteobacteria bacterium]|nr:hypothetical protein [Alphaproteobacteria bacterium]